MVREATEAFGAREDMRIPFYLTVVIDCFAFMSFITVLYFMSTLPDPKGAKLRPGSWCMDQSC